MLLLHVPAHCPLKSMRRHTSVRRAMRAVAITTLATCYCFCDNHCKYGSPYSIAERRVPELIPVLGRSQPAGDMNHKPGGRLPLLSARPAVTLRTLKRTATNFAAWWTEARWVWTVCLRLIVSHLRFEARPFCAWVQHANHSATRHPTITAN